LSTPPLFPSRFPQSLLDDINVHRGSLERLEAAVGAVLPLLDEPDQEQLRTQLDAVTGQYKSHLFDSEAYLAERWLEGKEAELSSLSLTAVQSPLLQEQIHRVQDFAAQVEKYRPNMDQLSSLAESADPAGEAGPSVANKALQERYGRLVAMSGERQTLLADYLPIVQQYESSRGAWLDLLCGWEEKAEKLPPPLATPTNIQAQLQDIKVRMLWSSATKHTFTVNTVLLIILLSVVCCLHSCCLLFTFMLFLFEFMLFVFTFMLFVLTLLFKFMSLLYMLCMYVVVYVHVVCVYVHVVCAYIVV
jgi:hypothetical protein